MVMAQNRMVVGRGRKPDKTVSAYPAAEIRIILDIRALRVILRLMAG